MDWYRPGLFGLDLLSTIIFILIPVLSVLLVFFTKRKFLWTAPILSTLLVAVFSTVVSGLRLWTVAEYRDVFLFLLIPMQLMIVVGFTVIAYAAAYISSKKKKIT